MCIYIYIYHVDQMSMLRINSFITRLTSIVIVCMNNECTVVVSLSPLFHRLKKRDETAECFHNLQILFLFCKNSSMDFFTQNYYTSRFAVVDNFIKNRYYGADSFYLMCHEFYNFLKRKT